MTKGYVERWAFERCALLGVSERGLRVRQSQIPKLPRVRQEYPLANPEKHPSIAKQVLRFAHARRAREVGLGASARLSPSRE